ncbi:hypothetical protein N9S30_00450 [bacterium]|nr:hypothetical protein [bacterium]
MSEQVVEDIIKEYLRPIQSSPNVESILAQDYFSLSEGLTAIARVRARFNESFGEWTNLGVNRAGQPTYFKASSFFNGVPIDVEDPGDLLREGEIRQIVVVTLCPRMKRYTGEVVVLRAWYPTRRVQRQSRAPSIVVRGLNCLPLLLPDTQIAGMKRSKKQIRIRGCSVVYGSVSEALALTKGSLPTVSVVHGQHLNALATWVVTEKEPKGQLFLCQQIDLTDFRAERTKTCKRIKNHLEQQMAHPPDKNHRLPERIKSDDEALLTAVDYFDTASIVGVLDLMCSGAFDGISISMLSAPREFPLFLSCCVILAAFPTHYRLNPSTIEDGKLSDEMAMLIHSNLPSCDVTTSQTAIEIAVQLAIENTGSQLVVPEHMRRQGLAVLAELLDGHSAGVFNPSSIRSSNRSKMLAAVLRTVREVDEWCHTGVYNGCRENIENNEDENERLCGVNHHAMSCVKDTLLNYFSTSVLRLANVAGIPFLAVRPNTRTKCGSCAELFDIRSSIYKGVTASCCMCAAFFCDACHEAMASVFVASEKKNRDVVKCVHCQNRRPEPDACFPTTPVATGSQDQAEND